MDDEGIDILDRIGKLDSLLLWVASLSSLGFSLVIAYLKMPLVPYIPSFYQTMLFLSGIFISIAASIMVRSAYDAAKERCKLHL